MKFLFYQLIAAESERAYDVIDHILSSLSVTPEPVYVLFVPYFEPFGKRNSFFIEVGIRACEYRVFPFVVVMRVECVSLCK